MVWQQQLKKNSLVGLRQLLKTTHGKVTLLGLSVGLIYLPVWLGYLIPQAFRGKIGWFLVFSMLFLAGLELWSKRPVLSQLEASEEDRLLGYLLTGSGILLFPFCRFAMWSQSLLWLIILAGIVCSTWGLKFFQRFMVPTFFVGMTVYPRIGLISRFLWELLTPPQFLETVMAWGGTLGMRAVGFPATQKGIFITFPEGAVEVGWGCNGLDMAITIAAAGLFMGLLYKQKKGQMVWLILSGALVALVFNIPRLMLVTVAHVYWGPWWFNFWHGFWGGQIFSGIVFTIYYYIFMALIRKSQQT